MWRALPAGLPNVGDTFAKLYATLVAAEPARATGTLPDEGATLPGFAVSEAVPEQRLKLSGKHRFSRYELDLILDAEPAATVLRARSSAEFPGLLGSGYRLLVIGTGGHRIIVPRMLRAIRRRAESA
ncbi:hypothetical protein AOZ06_51140 [Kibdelosporangium phytohabitans]|uniref:DUF2867 domain-containing protein n=1 Tax=Kibdelosporangium phytohabitans TaxID=860235 RepID=A0A0N9IJH4_9PSEU|nr:hypothetical protein AOZ06_51140 [Kibdelosporangium phytohabitans]